MNTFNNECRDASFYGSLFHFASITKMGTPLKRYVVGMLLYIGYGGSISRLRSRKHIPALSLVNCMSHHMIALVTLMSLAKLYAIALESGNNPVNRPHVWQKGGLLKIVQGIGGLEYAIEIGKTLRKPTRKFDYLQDSTIEIDYNFH